MQCVSFLSLFCHFVGAPSSFLGQAWADGKGKLATCRHRADSGGETVKKCTRHSLDRLHASMIKQKKQSVPIHPLSLAITRLPTHYSDSQTEASPDLYLKSTSTGVLRHRFYRPLSCMTSTPTAFAD